MFSQAGKGHGSYGPPFPAGGSGRSVDGDLPAGPRRLLDGGDDLERAEALPSGDERCLFPADDPAEVADLDPERVFVVDRDSLAVDRFQPASVFPVMPDVELGDCQRAVGSADLVAGFPRRRVCGVLAARQLPAPRADDRVARSDGPENAVLEA